MMSDFLLQKDPLRGTLYHQFPGIWYSKTLRRWMVTSPELVRMAMYNEAFSVPTYDVSPITHRLNVNVRHLDQLREWFPLAVEGEKHRTLREKFARHITRNTRVAMEALSAELDEKKELISEISVGETFCLYSKVMRPAIMKSLITLAQLEIPLDRKIEELPLLFDVRLPIKLRKDLNELIGKIIADQSPDIEPDDRYLRAAVLTLSVNTLVGSVSLTILEGLKKTPNTPLTKVPWPEQLIRTGLPIIEKVATQDAVLGGQHIRSGQGLRLFIESEGVHPNGAYSFSEIFFAVGNHKCLGMNFSKQVWDKCRNFVASIDRPLQILELGERSNDYVFNFPNLIKVQFSG